MWYTFVQTTLFRLPEPFHFIQNEWFYPGEIRRRSRTKSVLKFSAVSGRWNQKSELDFIHAVILSDGPTPFCVIFTQFFSPFCYHLPFAIFLLLCITYTKCTSPLAVLIQPHSSSSRSSPHSAGNRRHPWSSVEQNDSRRHFFRSPQPRRVTGYATLILALLCWKFFMAAFFHRLKPWQCDFRTGWQQSSFQFVAVSLA